MMHLRADGLLESENQNMRPESPRNFVFLACVCREVIARGSLLSGQVAATHRLESHDDVGDL